MKRISLRPEDYSIDNRPTSATEMRFDGSNPALADGERIVFRNPKTGVETVERVGEANMLGTNGSYIFTPAACDDELAHSNVDAIGDDTLEGNLLVLDLSEPVAYGVEEIRALLEEQGVDLEPREVAEHIVLFRTGVMSEILSGTPPQERPGLTPEAAQFLAGLNIAKAYGIDSQSYEVQGHDGFPTTPELLNPQADGSFTPIVYQLVNLDGIESCQSARISIGNAPREQVSWPVSVSVR